MILPDEKVPEILKIFTENFILPEKKKPQCIVCPIGLVGAGKTTVMRPLSERLSLLRISTDELREILQERGFDYDRVWELAMSVGRAYAREGYRIGVDADCADHETQEALDAVSTELHIPILYIHINPPEDFIIHKLRTFKHTWLFSDADHAVKNYFARKPVHAHLGMPFVYSFDTSKDNIASQVEEAADIITSKLVQY